MSKVAKLNRDDVVIATRRVFRHVGEEGLIRDVAISRIARDLDFGRTSPRIREAIDGGLRAASRRGVVYSKQGRVYPYCKWFRDYSRDDLKDALLAVLGRTWWDQEEAIRAAVRYLGFSKVNPKKRRELRPALKGLILQDRLERDGGWIRAIR